ncbi:hypothetical protein IFR05_005972 [Cadophora sp. M221]|nr:hypothetical protein IFR05_005972 [Cadophora sp. M221]
MLYDKIRNSEFVNQRVLHLFSPCLLLPHPNKSGPSRNTRLRPHSHKKAIVVDFFTTPDFIASVLPPGFEAQEQPTGHIVLSGMEIKLCGEFDCVIVTMDVKYQGRSGTYMLEIIISGDSPVTWGREVWGECKKTGTYYLIPIKSISEFKYHSGRADYTVVEESELGCGDAYFPYMIGRHYEDLRIFKIGAEWTQSKDSEQEPEIFPVQRLTTPGFK